MAIGGFIVRTGDRVVLLDAGAGPGPEAPVSPGSFERIEDAPSAIVERWRSRGMSDDEIERAVRNLDKTSMSTGGLEKSMGVIGIAPEQVTDVVCSHLHYDHIGWVTRSGAPFFPNATVRVERRDLDYFLGPGQKEEAYFTALYGAVPISKQLAPVLDRIEPWDGDSCIAPGIKMVFAPGHTPGNSYAVLSSGVERALVLGDTIHCPLELTDPEFSLMGDMDQGLADRARTVLRDLIEGEPSIRLTSPHFPDLRFGRMLPGVGKHGWVFE
jgi:glyoxylase-like metal-dependent hydrolase (beta-lactamase superfamily II)